MADKIPRSGADCHKHSALSIATESHTDGGTKKRRPKRSSVQGDEAEGADPPKVKQEEMSDSRKQVVLKRRSEERGPTERKRKAAVAASQKDAVVARAAPLAIEGKPRRITQNALRPQTVMLLATPAAKEEEAQ